MCIYELKDESDNAKTTLPAMEFSIFFEAFTTTFTWIVSAGPLLLITGASNVAWLTMALDMVLGREKKRRKFVGINVSRVPPLNRKLSAQCTKRAWGKEERKDKQTIETIFTMERTVKF